VQVILAARPGMSPLARLFWGLVVVIGMAVDVGIVIRFKRRRGVAPTRVPFPATVVTGVVLGGLGMVMVVSGIVGLL